jgi:hypothetical protein
MMPSARAWVGIDLGRKSPRRHRNPELAKVSAGRPAGCHASPRGRGGTAVPRSESDGPPGRQVTGSVPELAIPDVRVGRWPASWVWLGGSISTVTYVRAWRSRRPDGPPAAWMPHI